MANRAKHGNRHDIAPAATSKGERPDLSLDPTSSPASSARDIAPAGNGGDDGDSRDNGDTIVSFDDNKAAGSVFGEHDRNLALIESRLNVDIVARGNRLALRGDEGSRKAARNVLEELYQRAVAGLDITSGDVDGAIRMATALPRGSMNARRYAPAARWCARARRARRHTSRR